MPAVRIVIAGMLGVAFAIAILVVPGLLVGHTPAVQSVVQQGANLPLYATASPSSSSSNVPSAIETSQPSPQAISSLSASSAGSLMLLGAASLAISFGLALFLSRRLK